MSRPGFTASVHTLWAKYDGGGTMTARYLTSGEETVARVTVGGAVSWLLADRLGSTRLVADAAGAVVSAVEYTAFGGIASQSGTDAQTGNVLFTGGWYDREVGLYQMHWRSYDPANGQWTSEDPIGFSAGDMNTRRYVGNNATNGVDRNGLQDKERRVATYDLPKIDVLLKARPKLVADVLKELGIDLTQTKQADKLESQFLNLG